MKVSSLLSSSSSSTVAKECHKTGPKSFPQFKSLPLELRLKIYSFAISPRLVSIFAYPVAYRDGPPDRERLLNYEGDWLDFSAMTAHIERFFTTPAAVPPLLHVDSESRSFVLSRRFRPIEAIRNPGPFDEEKMFLRGMDPDGNSKRGYSRPLVFLCAIPLGKRYFSLVDPRSDVFFLEDPNISRSRFTVSTIDVMVRWLDPYCLDNLRRLVVPYYTWRKALIFHHLSALTEFKALEELYISFLGSEEAPPNRDWASHVGGFDPYVEDMKRHVLDDFTELVKKFPEWRRPTVRFTKDKRSLLKELEFDKESGQGLKARSTIFELPD